MLYILESFKYSLRIFLFSLQHIYSSVHPSQPHSTQVNPLPALVSPDTRWLSYLLCLWLVVKEHRTHLGGDPIRGYYKSFLFLLFTSPPYLRSLVLCCICMATRRYTNQPTHERRLRRRGQTQTPRDGHQVGLSVRDSFLRPCAFSQAVDFEQIQCVWLLRTIPLLQCCLRVVKLGNPSLISGLFYRYRSTVGGLAPNVLITV